MRHNSWLVGAALAAACAAISMFSACDDGDSGLTGSEYYIRPAEVTMGSDDVSVILESVGGIPPQTWSVSDATLGSITSNDSFKVVYTRTDKKGINRVTVRDSRTWEATATINQLDTAAASDLAVSPTSITLSTKNAQTVFTASGGDQPYTWSVGDSSRGHLVTQSSDSQIVYVRDTAGDNTVIVTDSAGAVALATVSQPSETGLTITATPSTLSSDGAVAILKVTGGVPNYTWSVSDDSLGGLSATTGTTVTYTRNHSGNNVVSVTDGNGNTTSVILTQP